MDAAREKAGSSLFVHYPAGAPEAEKVWNKFFAEPPSPFSPSTVALSYKKSVSRSGVYKAILLGLFITAVMILGVLASLGKLPIGRGQGTWVGFIFVIVFSLAFITAAVLSIVGCIQKVFVFFTQDSLIQCLETWNHHSSKSIPKDAIRSVAYSEVTGVLTVQAKNDAADLKISGFVEHDGLVWLCRQIADWAGVPAKIEFVEDVEAE